MRAVRDGPVLRSPHGLGPAAVVLSVALLAACGPARVSATAGGAAPRARSGVAETTTDEGASEVPVAAPTAPSVTAPPGAGATAGTSTTGTGTPVTAVPRTGPSAPPPSACAPRDLRASLDVQPDAASSESEAVGRTQGLIVLTDVSASACTVEGFGDMDAVEGGVARALLAGEVDQAGPPAEVVLASGASAFAGMEWTSAPTCPDVTSLLLTPPGGTVALPVDVVVPDGLRLPLDVCSAGIELGPFAATSEGTLSFPAR